MANDNQHTGDGCFDEKGVWVELVFSFVETPSTMVIGFMPMISFCSVDSVEAVLRDAHLLVLLFCRPGDQVQLQHDVKAPLRSQYTLRKCTFKPVRFVRDFTVYFPSSLFPSTARSAENLILKPQEVFLHV